MRLRAVQALEQFPGVEPVRGLAGAVIDDDARVRRAAVAALAARDEPGAVLGLVSAGVHWAGADPELTATAVRILRRSELPGRARSLVAAALRGSGEDFPLAEVLPELFDDSPRSEQDEVLARLAEALNDTDDDQSRKRASQGLAALGSRATTTLLAQAQTSRSPEAALVLGRVGGERAAFALVRMLESNDVVQRRAAVRALIEMRDPRAVRVLLAATHDTDDEVRASAMRGLDELGTAGVVGGVMTAVRALVDDHQSAPAVVNADMAAHGHQRAAVGYRQPVRQLAERSLRELPPPRALPPGGPASNGARRNAHEPPVAPHGGSLVDLVVSDERADELRALAGRWPALQLAEQQLCELELLATGALSPLRGYMGSSDIESVRTSMRIDGTIWPTLLVLRVRKAPSRALCPGGWLGLYDGERNLVAAVEAQEIYAAPPWLASAAGSTLISGRVEALPARHPDFRDLRLTPAQVRRQLDALGWRRVIDVQTGEPLHRAEYELTLRAAQAAGARLLLHPLVGLPALDDGDHYARVRACEAILGRYPQRLATLALLPRVGGDRQVRALLRRAIIARNYGATHLLVGPEGAVPGADRREIAAIGRQFINEVGVELLPWGSYVYADESGHVDVEDLPPGASGLRISHSELGEWLAEGREIPAWFSFAEVLDELRRGRPPRLRQGLTLFVVGPVGSRAPQVARHVLAHVMERGGGPCTLLDGEAVRHRLATRPRAGDEQADEPELVRRIAWMASEITKSGGIAICAPVAPIPELRREARDTIERLGGFVLVGVDAAHAADPIADADLLLDGDAAGERAAARIVAHLERRGYVERPA